MKKIIILFIMCLLLCGCTNENIEYNSKLNTIFSNSEHSELRQNNFTNYFDYYVPSDLLETDFDETSVTFNYNEALINMNINIQNILNEEYYIGLGMSDEGYFDSSNELFSFNGQFVNANLENTSFFVKLYQIDEYFFYLLKTNDITIYARCVKNELVEIADKLYTLCKTVSINKDLILSVYANKDVIDYQRKSIELFDTKMPESGIINDLIFNNDDETIEDED